MERLSQRAGRSLLFIISVLGWFALIAQLYLIIHNRVTSIPETIIRYFSFFTILTNLLVAICSAVLLIKLKSAWYHFFSSAKTITAITLYITIVGLVYNLILRFLWKPQGLQFLVDELLHTVIPLFFILFWIMIVPRACLKVRDILPWLMYPFVYIIYTLIRGAFVDFYPYPFVNVNELGYSKVFLNSSLLVLAFVLFSLLFVVIDKLKKAEALRQILNV